MRKACFTLAALFALTVVALYSSAQEKPKPDSKPPATTLKIQVVIAEHEGEKKLANLPYVFFLEAYYQGPGSPWTKVRMGSRVPVATGSFQVGVGGGSTSGASSVNPLVNTQFQYIDVGTNIDARAMAADDGRFDLTMNLERSWVEGEVIILGEKQTGAAGDPNAGSFKQPIIRQFKTEVALPMRDGQTIQSTQATDPLSGRVVTITVTMNVVK